MQDEKTVLTVDNDTAVREMLRDIIVSFGYKCLEAKDAREAIDILRGQAVDLMLLDIHMPGARGNQLLKFIRDNGIKTPVIVISGYLLQDVVREIAGLDVKAVLGKPIRIKRLAEEIAKVFTSGPST
jgi:CheY-like chemotaxis protein